MTTASVKILPMQYLDKALSSLRNLGLVPEERDQEPMTALLDQIAGLDENKVVVIARTLDQMSFFNEIVREQVRASVSPEEAHGIFAGNAARVYGFDLEAIAASVD